MMKLSHTLAIAVAAVCVLNFGLVHVHDSFTGLVERQGGLDSVNPDLFRFYHDISEDALKAEDPTGYALLAELEHTPERTELVAAWMFNTRQAIFIRRHGYAYAGRDD